jgi:hypothetical protein
MLIVWRRPDEDRRLRNGYALSDRAMERKVSWFDVRSRNPGGHASCASPPRSTDAFRDAANPLHPPNAAEPERTVPFLAFHEANAVEEGLVTDAAHSERSG